jgi:DNA-binding response OmpR family regulator
LTGKEDRESKIRGLDLGASDITKPFDTGELMARVKVHLKMKTLQDQLKQANAAAGYLQYGPPDRPAQQALSGGCPG